MKTLLITIALTSALSVALGHPAHASEWDAADKALFAGFSVARVADMAQTLQIARRPEKISPGTTYYETNPLMGKHPSTGTVVAYFALSHALVWLVADQLAPKTRKAFLVGTIIISAGYVKRNAEIGISVKF